MKIYFLLAVVLWTSYIYAACSKNLLLENNVDTIRASESSLLRSHNDGVITDLRRDVPGKRVDFIAAGAGIYVSIDVCRKIESEGYIALNLLLQGPANASLTIELQTSSSCFTTRFTSYFTNLTLATDHTRTYEVPLSIFSGANLNAVRSIKLLDLTPGFWEIGESQLVCANSYEMSSASSFHIESSKTAASQALLTRQVAAECTPFLLDDFVSQSRLTFLFYNAALLPSSDDGTMSGVTGRVDTQTSVIVADHHLTLVPANVNSYWYTQIGCLKATNQWGGIGLPIIAEPGTTLRIELSSDASCSNTNPKNVALTSRDLGWTFDGTEKYYQIPFSKFPGLDTDHLVTLLFTGLDRSITFGPIALYCGNTGTAYVPPPTLEPAEPNTKIPPTTGASNSVIDTFSNINNNNLGFYHGGDDQNAFQISNSKLTINTKRNADSSWYTQLANGCMDLTPLQDGYLHISFSGSNAFTVSLQQHNPTCNEKIQPNPFTWDSVEAARYSNPAKTDIFVPITHFAIDRSKSIGFSLKGFYSSNPTTISRIEIVKNVPNDFLVPSKLATSPLIFSCTRPNSFAFAIDDGDPKFAQRVVSTIAEAGIKVTFFTVGAALRDSSTNLTGVYKGMLDAGHQVAYHSFTHPPMEGLPSLAAIDWEIDQDIQAVRETLGITSTYFRPPFGTEGARVRQRLQSLIPGSKFIMWSVDVQDYLWATSPTPENQITNFQSDVDKGGSLVVMHYLYDTTVNYLPRFIAIAKSTGKQLMRVDQCLEDPAAPPL
ncbi:putative chitin deacetylase [Erysiphe neolycopersici]|uniref:Putative chitin deacetylase n=1 Tax=Erysiphe neolycopersici TaxID=212602 RepID=A0A420HQ05_9PEZI|nr:putative chitin deacetylase [Erysiphe neolycopersici]